MYNVLHRLMPLVVGLSRRLGVDVLAIIYDANLSSSKAWVSCMLAGGLREERSALPAYVTEAVERLVGDNTFRGREGEKECEEAGVRLELEDIARER